MHLTTTPAHHLLGLSSGKEVSRTDMPAAVVLSVEGDIDLHTGPDLRRALEELLVPVGAGLGAKRTERPSAGSQAAPPDDGSGAVRALVVDLSAVEFIDSYAVGVLVHGHHQARRNGRAYVLVATHSMIHMLFKVTGLAKVMPLHPDVATAVAALPAVRSTSV